jgi:pantoate--beta-alanine ligase
MKIVTGILEMQNAAHDLRAEGKRIALVPTMGYLHEGHLSLMRIARQHAEAVVTSIFVNPTQFGPTEDFAKYPRDIERDTRLAAAAGTDILFVPSSAEMYPDGYATYISVERITEVLEGKVRPTHFRGVATVVAKLFHCTEPHVAVFGQKDAQQVAVIRRMALDLNFGVEIAVAPIVREPDGLAMSSRNVYLSPGERAQATVLSRSLLLAAELARGGERHSDAIKKAMTSLISAQPAANIDYISVADSSTLEELPALAPGAHVLVSLAVRFGATRLIDNTLLTI